MAKAWTWNHPTEGGWYWRRSTNRDKVFPANVVRVYHNNRRWYRDGIAIERDEPALWWPERIKEPPAVRKAKAAGGA